MKTVLAVLRVLGEWLAGAVALIVLSWCFLMFAEDGTEVTPRILALRHQWMFWTCLLSVPLGYPFFALLRAIKDEIENPPIVRIAKAMTDIVEVSQRHYPRW